MNEVGKTGTLDKALRDVADEERLAYNWSRIEARRHRDGRRAPRLALAAAAALILVGVIVGVVVSVEFTSDSAPEPLFLALSEWTPVIAVPSKASTEKRVTLSDGSRLTLAPGASLEIKESSDHRLEMALQKGWVRFNVTPGQGRTWVVEAGLGRVVVLGTQFTVSRTPRTVKVAVHRGTVALQDARTGRDIATLTKGESRELRAPEADAALASKTQSPQAEQTTPPPDETPSEPDQPPKRTNAKGLPGASKPAMPKTPMSDLAGLGSSAPVNDLLRAADDARKQHQPREAAALLGRIIKEFPGDPAVGLVALSLGRIRLESLRQPGPAARAFKRAALSKGLPAPLREQAHARCVEALKKAGELASARSMRDSYKKQYPNGAWLPWVEHWAKSQ